MQKLSKGFIWRIARALCFIVLVILFCTAVSGAGIFLAARFSLTRSRGQVPLTALSIGAEGPLELPVRGRTVEGEGWTLRNSRDIYTLTLDNAVIEGQASEEGTVAGISVTGDLIIDLKAGSSSRIASEGAGILSNGGTVVIKGKGKLEIKGDKGAVVSSGHEDKQPFVEAEEGLLVVEGQLDGEAKTIRLQGEK